MFVDGDADMGAGVTPIRGQFDVTVVAAQASTISVTNEPVEEQP